MILSPYLPEYITILWSRSPLGALKMAGALGVLADIAVPALGFAGVFLLLAVGSLVTRLAV